ncbi:MAG TPA: hypothetical protein VLF39_02855 [Candidatus Saccharimonadales bacterium]|nr:hypothetical protein [Candidatus Saccharimonadales bacterium]
MDITTAVKAMKSAADVYGKAKKIPEQKQILEGLAVIAVLQQEKFDLEEKIRNIAIKLRKAREQLDTRSRFELAYSVYWLKTDKDKDQPYCPSCYAVGLEMPLQADERHSKKSTWWRCPNKDCQGAFNPWDYHEPIHHSSGFEPWGG